MPQETPPWLQLGDKPLMALVPLLLILVIAVTEMASDLYVPSLPSLQHYFLTSESLVQGTLSINLLGLAISGPIYGALSDAFGRRWVMLGGVAIFCLGSCGAAMSATITQLLIWRFIQGFGGGVAYVVGLAVIKDRYKGDQCAEILSQIAITTAICPAAAPLLGAHILDWFGWQANFWFIAALSCLVFMFLFLSLPETLHPFRKTRLSWVRTRVRYHRALTNPTFMGNAFMSAATLAGVWALFAAAPFVLIEQQKLSVIDFSYYCAVGVMAYGAGALVNHWLFPRWGLRRLLAYGLGISIAGSMVFLYVAISKKLILMGVYLGTIIVDFGSALVFSTAITEALDPLPQQSGTAAAILGTIEIGLSSLVVFILGFFDDQSIMPVAIVMAVCSTLAAFAYLWLHQSSLKDIFIKKGFLAPR
jgi:DHA1 family bicyclomycin/chloramphenicol resistance-like MFS transporter